MIEELHIRGLGVIEDASVALSSGLTVVTGETGAGKTMLVTALQLLTGARADSSLVRAGVKAATVDAVIDPAPESANQWLADPDDVLVVSREVPASGRSRARIGGRVAPVSALADLLGQHVEIHAQHEHVRLSRPDTQRHLLDRYAGDDHANVMRQYRDAYQHWRSVVDRREQLAATARERARTLAQLRAEVAEIDAVELDPDTDENLSHALERLANAHELQHGTAEAAAALGSDSAGQLIGVAVDLLRRLPVDDPVLKDIRARAEAMAAEVVELATDVRAYGEEVDADPARLEQLQERKQVVTSLTRKYGTDVYAVLAYAAEAHEQIADLEEDDASAGALDEDEALAWQHAQQLAAEVRHGRRKAADGLARAVDEHLAELAMPHARFEVVVASRRSEVESNAAAGQAAASDVTTDEATARDGLTEDGGDHVTFVLAANPGEPARPIADAASGGERSRVSLAIEVALADVDDASVLVFDEVDAGIGGATAMAVGRKLARLANAKEARQVLCVTHLAQLAAFADLHHVVEKQVVDGRTVTVTRQVTEQGRVAELARMFGSEDTAEAGMEHARELLVKSQTPT